SEQQSEQPVSTQASQCKHKYLSTQRWCVSRCCTLVLVADQRLFRSSDEGDRPSSAAAETAVWSGKSRENARKSNRKCTVSIILPSLAVYPVKIQRYPLHVLGLPADA